MAKPRHDQQPTSSRSTLAILSLGGLLVAGLIVWALTRTVEPAATPSTDVVATTPVVPETMPPVTGTEVPTGTPVTTAPAAPAVPLADDTASVTRIAAEDVRAKMGRGEVTLIDVRDGAAYATEHIEGALSMPLATVEGQVDTLPKGKAIVTYCTWPAEETSARAALILQKKGFTQVMALYGGMAAWKNLGYPTGKS